MSIKNIACKEALKSLRLIYDIIIIDCPPALNLLTINALCAADELVIPTTCDYFAVEGLGSLMRAFESLKRKGLSSVHLMGIVCTIYNQGEPLSQKIAKDLKSNMGQLLFNTVIPYCSQISEAPSVGKPVILYDKNAIGSKAYLSLAAEILSPATNSSPAIAATPPPLLQQQQQQPSASATTKVTTVAPASAAVAATVATAIQ